MPIAQSVIDFLERDAQAAAAKAEAVKTIKMFNSIEQAKTEGEAQLAALRKTQAETRRQIDADRQDAEKVLQDLRNQHEAERAALQTLRDETATAHAAREVAIRERKTAEAALAQAKAAAATYHQEAMQRATA